MNNVGTGPDCCGVRSMHLQTYDGKIILSGDFTNFNGTAVNKIVRLNSNGTIDTTFTNNAGLNIDGPARVMANFNNIFLVATDTKLVALALGNGTISTTFNTNIGTSAAGIEDIKIQLVNTQQRVVIAGSFTTWNGNSVSRVVRLAENGAFETKFGKGANDTIYSIAVQPKVQGLTPNTQLVFGGAFTDFDGQFAKNLVRLNSNGTREELFVSNMGNGFNGKVDGISITKDDDLIVTGVFDGFNQENRTNIAKIGGGLSL
jgi:hypothetical protein